jgi:citrate lyase subunit beta/citryl-CoA lyase
MFRDDLDWLEDIASPDAVMLPKAHDSWAIDHVGSAGRGVPVIPLIETARGVLNAFALTAAKAVMPAFVFGAEDLTAEIGISRTVDGEELLFARSQVVLAATAAGADAIDGIVVDIGNDDLLRRDARRARALGFHGKLAVHPSQVAIINEVFSPTAEEVDRARRIVDAHETAVARGEGVLRLDGRMVDTPIVVRARSVVALADRIEKRF